MNAPVRQSDFIGQLCVALAHRWEPERAFVVLTAYFDESGTHAGAELSLMAGFVGDARQWRKFEKRTTKLFSRFRVDVFHTIDVRRTDKDFRDWKVDRKLEFLDEFHHIINETLERGFASILRNDDYEYYQNLPWPKKARKDSKYTVLFRSSLASVIRGVLKIPRWMESTEPQLHIVLESGHRNASDAVRLYNFAKSKVKGTSKPLAGLTFATKADCLPLAAADLFAYSAYHKEVGGKPLGTPKQPMKSEASYKENMYRILLNRPTLDALYQQAIEFAIERSSSLRLGSSDEQPL